jgi:hypothetical protein
MYQHLSKLQLLLNTIRHFVANPKKIIKHVKHNILFVLFVFHFSLALTMPDTADGNQKSERHVRFAGTEVKNEHGSELPQIKSFESKLTQPTLAPPPEDTELIPRRIELKDPKTHLAVASCLLFFLLVLAFQMDDVADVKQKAERDATKGRTKTMGRYAMVQDRFKDKIEKSFEAEPRRDLPCSFFLASSSLPGVQGFGIYAGTKFDEGASVVNNSCYLCHQKFLIASNTGFHQIS